MRLESYRAIISLNIIKPMYQTSYVISKHQEKIDAQEIYLELYKESSKND
jgi:hypothetical protein